MAIQSLSIHKLKETLLPIVSADTLATANLLQVVRIAHAITIECEDPNKRAVAWVLMKAIEFICHKYDNSPLEVDVHDILLLKLRKISNQAAAFLSDSSVNAKATIALCNEIIELYNSDELSS